MVGTVGISVGLSHYICALSIHECYSRKPKRLKRVTMEYRVCLVLVFVALITKEAMAAQHVVGGSQGWEESTDFSSWASGQKFKVGDQLGMSLLLWTNYTCIIPSLHGYYFSLDSFQVHIRAAQRGWTWWRECLQELWPWYCVKLNEYWQWCCETEQTWNTLLRLWYFRPLWPRHESEDYGRIRDCSVYPRITVFIFIFISRSFLCIRHAQLFCCICSSHSVGGYQFAIYVLNMYIWCERLKYSTVPIFVIWFCMLIFCGVKYVWCENCSFFFCFFERNVFLLLKIKRLIWYSSVGFSLRVS